MYPRLTPLPPTLLGAGFERLRQIAQSASFLSPLSNAPSGDGSATQCLQPATMPPSPQVMEPRRKVASPAPRPAPAPLPDQLHLLVQTCLFGDLAPTNAASALVVLARTSCCRADNDIQIFARRGPLQAIQLLVAALAVCETSSREPQGRFPRRAPPPSRCLNPKNTGKWPLRRSKPSSTQVRLVESASRGGPTTCSASGTACGSRS